jgi:hypothetical protein
MKDDVIRFRKICSNLIAGKTKTAKQIQGIMNISEPTFKRLMTAPLDDEFRIRASILGAVQDLNKKFCDYERIDIEPETRTESPSRGSRKEIPSRTPEADPAGLISDNPERTIQEIMIELLGKFPPGTELIVTFKAVNI